MPSSMQRERIVSLSETVISSPVPTNVTVYSVMPRCLTPPGKTLTTAVQRSDGQSE